MRRLHAASPDGFTLIELLVVCAIISILAGLTMVGLQVARRSGQVSATSTDIQMLVSRIESVKNGFGDFPPTSLELVKVKGNGLNDGNESLFAFLLSKRHGGPFGDDLKEDRWQNADKDEVRGAELKTLEKELNWIRGSGQLLEYTDLWGAPYVYIHARDYTRKHKYQLGDGTLFEVEAQKNPQTGAYYAASRFQLWSLGPDGINQNGEGDDVVSWK